MKKLIAISLALILALSLCACGGGELVSDLLDKEPESKTFEVNGMSITLTDEFRETEMEGKDACYLTDSVGVVVTSEAYSAFTDIGYEIDDITLEQYAEWVLIAGGYSDSEVKEKDGIVYFIYDGGNNFTYYGCVFKAEENFVTVNFYTTSSEFDSMEDTFAEWAQTITFN